MIKTASQNSKNSVFNFETQNLEKVKKIMSPVNPDLGEPLLSNYNFSIYKMEHMRSTKKIKGSFKPTKHINRGANSMTTSQLKMLYTSALSR
jgi:hypothetical protein